VKARVRTTGFLLCSLLAVAAPGFAQARDGKLLVTVVDTTGGVLPGATVTIAGTDDATKATTLAPFKASDKGLATAENLLAGRYQIQAEFPGFEPGVLKDIRVRSGENKQTIILKLKSVQADVQVAQDAQAAAANPRGGAFGSTLTREEINALSDDRTVMAQQLQDMAGGNATFKVDSFTGAPLPPKSQIKSIHIVRDTFAAENHSAEADEIDIITQPGLGKLEGSASSRVRDGAWSGRSPFTPVKGPERSQTYQADLGGTVVREKSSFAVTFSSRRAFDTPNINVATPAGTISRALSLQRPNNNWSVESLLDYALTRDQIVRFAFDVSDNKQANLGVGAYDLPERAYSTTSLDRELRVSHSGPLGRRLFLNTRLQLNITGSESHSTSEAQTIRVTDAFTSGGAQVRGGRHARDFEFGSDLDYVKGLHSVRAGLMVVGGYYRADNASNYLGTFVFPSQAAFDARLPATYTQRVGDPLITYWNVQTGAYLQDDFRVRKSLTLSFGARYEAQTHVSDFNNFDPRAGLTWAPFKSGRTTIRASVGLFHQWLNSGTYEQTLRVDGVRQRDITIINPSFPDPGVGGTAPPSSRYLLGPSLVLPRTMRISAGIDQTLTPHLRISALYSRVRAASVLRGENLNAPVGGVRPDPAFANVIDVVSDAEQHSDQLQSTLTINLASKSSSKGTLNWHRTTMRVTYYLAKVSNNSDGAFAPPPQATLATEWGPAAGDRRHRLTTSVTTTALKNMSATLTLAGNTGTPYNVTTGFDDNRDAIFNDRPVGTSRNALRMPGQWTLGANASYAVPIEGANGHEYRVSFNFSAENLTNHANYTGFSGVMTSPFFQQATAVSSVRRITLGANFSF
jgi:Carboxypeptidase regulatory-like domain